jgi:uncharacterized protein (TIGR02001 family)
VRTALRRLRWGRSVACALPGCVLAVATHAQLSTTVGVESDYRYRGVSLSNSEPSPRVTLNYDAPERWYAGASAVRAAIVAGAKSTQLLGYAGWVSSAVDGRSFEVGIDGSHFTGVSGYDFAEAYVGLLASRWSARAYYAPNYYGRRIGAAYLELNAHASVSEQVRVFAHLGALAPVHGGGGDAGKARGDISLGGGYVSGGWDLHLAAVAATASGPYPAVYAGRRGALVAGVSFSF